MARFSNKIRQTFAEIKQQEWKKRKGMEWNGKERKEKKREENRQGCPTNKVSDKKSLSACTP